MKEELKDKGRVEKKMVGKDCVCQKATAHILVAILLLMLFSELSFALVFRGGEITLIRPDSGFIDKMYTPPEFLSVEDMTFITCIEEEDVPVTSSILCVDDTSFTDIPMTRWEGQKNCFIGEFNLDFKPCGQMIILSEYIKDEETVTLRQEIKVNRLTSVLDTVIGSQYSDGGWKNAVETSSGIWVLSNYPDIYDDELELGLNWLKLNRNNDEKCWPDRDCNLRITAKILAYLSMSGYDEARRVVHDGEVFLEKRQNYYDYNDRWLLNITTLDPGTTECILNYNHTHLNDEMFNLTENSMIDYLITPRGGQSLYVICDQNVRVRLFSATDEQIVIYEGDNMSYSMPYNCWSIDSKWGACDLQATLFAMMTNISNESKAKGFDYLQSQLHEERSGEMYIGSGNITDTALYLWVRSGLEAAGMDITAQPGRNESIAWLRYKQNNIGSWGRDTVYEDIYPTGFSIMALMKADFNRTHEVIRDAESYVIDTELEFLENLTVDYVAWNNTEMDALGYIVLKNNARPMLKTNPRIIMMDKESMEIEVFNPTTFDLEDVSAEFSENLKDIFEIEQEQYIDSYSYVKLDITKKVGETGSLYGYLIFKNNDEEIAKIPVMTVSVPKISISIADGTNRVFGTSSKLDFEVTKTSHTFQCSLDWEEDDITSKAQYSVSGEKLSVDISFTEAERLEKTYHGEFICTADGNQVHLPFFADISRYETFPFTVEPESLLVNASGQETKITIKNKLDESLDISLSFDKPLPDFELASTTLTIDPNGEAEVIIHNNVGAQENSSAAATIVVKGLEQAKQVRLRSEIVYVAGSPISPMLFWSLIGIALIIMGTVGYFAYSNRKSILSLFKKGNKTDDLKIRIKKLEEKEKKTGILNMIKIMRMLNKDEKTIRKRLLDEGFLEAEIDMALATDEDAQDADSQEDMFSSGKNKK